MDLLNLIDPYLPLIRVALFMTSAILIATTLVIIALRAYNASRLDFRGAGKDYGDQRGHIRYTTMGVMEFVGEATNGASTAGLMNLSAKGACLITPRVFKIGQEIVGRVCAVNKMPEEVIGSVIWVKPKTRFYQYGIEFKAIIPQFIKPTRINPYLRTQQV